MRGIALALLGAAVLGLSACGGGTSRDDRTEIQASVCVVEQLYGLDEEQLEALLLDPSPRPWQELARACEPHSDAA